MSGVDSRIVTMKFDNKQFESGAAETMSTLDKLKSSLGFSGASKGLENLAATTSSVEGGVSKINSAFLALGTVAVTAIATVTTKLMSMGGAIAQQLAGINAMKDGFADYELKVGATQTIMSGTGEGIGAVTKYLKELDVYADKTIYSLSDMTNNIGKFTNAGVKLPVAVDAMKGISNVAALSGASAEEAARSMYNLGQAIGNGTVKLMDWRSVELANMGTKEFKEQLIGSALAAGTLTKGTDGIIRSAKGAEVNYKTFSGTLKDGWLTAEALTDTLGNYADETTAIGEKAYKAATEVKTFSMMMETLKAAAGTGWTDTYEILIGSLPEATELFTGITNAVGGFIGASADARNKVLGDWKALEGRTMLIAGIKNIFEAIGAVLKPIKEAFRDIFPPATGEQLAILTERFLTFTQKLKIGDETAQNLKNTFKGVFALFSIVGQVISGVVGFIGDLIGAVGKGSGGFLEFTGGIGLFISGIDEALKKGEGLKKFFEGLSNFITPLVSNIFGVAGALASMIGSGAGNFLGDLSAQFQKFGPSIDVVKQKIDAFINFVKEAMGKAVGMFNFSMGGDPAAGLEGSLGKLLAALNAGLFAAVLVAIRGFTKSFGGAVKDLRGIFGSASGVLDQLTSNLKTMQADVKADIVLKIAAALAILAAAVFVLSMIDTKRLGVALGALAVMLTELVVAMNLLENQTSILGAGKMAVVAAGLLILSVALLAMSAALAILGNMETATLVRGLTSVAAILGVIIAATSLLSKTGGAVSMLVTATALLVLSAALTAFAGALKVYSMLDTGTMLEGGLKVAAALGAISLVLNKLKLGPKMLVSAVTLIVVAEALVIMAAALKLLGGLSVEEMAKSITMLGASLLIIAIGLNAMTGAIGGAAAMIVFAAALALMTPPLVVLGNMDLASIGKALLVLVGVFTVFGLASVVLGPIIPVMLGLAVAIGLLGVAALAVGGGLMMFGAGLAALAASGAAGVAVLVGAVSAIAQLFPFIMSQVALAIVAFARIIGESAPTIIAALGQLVTALLKEAEKIIPKLPPIISQAISAFLAVVVTNLPKFVQAGVDLVIKLLEGITNNIGKLAKKAADLVIAFMNAWAEEIPRLADAGAKAVIKLVNGISNAIRDNTDEMNAAGRNLGSAIIKGMTSGITGAVGAVRDAAVDAARTALNAAKSFLGIKSPSKEFRKLGRYMDEGMAIGLKDYAGTVESATEDVGASALDTMRTALAKVSDSMNSNVDLAPVITPVLDLSKFQSDAAKISSVFGSKTISPGVSFNQAATISNATQDDQNGSIFAANQPTEASIIFEQNNYSPKALSAVELYRQTKNQLSLAKGVLT